MDIDVENELWKNTIKSEKHINEIKLKRKSRSLNTAKSWEQRAKTSKWHLRIQLTQKKSSYKGTVERSGEREQTNRRKKEQKTEEEDADATAEEQATQRKTGEENTGSLFFPQKGARNPTKRTRGRTPQHYKDEARGGGKRQGARGKRHLETNTKGTNN